MKIRKAKINDLESIMRMYNSCVKGMLNNNITQWDESYPNTDIIKTDIVNKTYFIAEIKKEIVGGINIDNIQDKAYSSISWKDTSEKFLVVHRLAVKSSMWNCNIGKQLMVFAEEFAIKKNLNSIRLDTYSGNPKGIKFYIRLGYVELGAINLKPDKNEYYCFEKILQ